MHPGGMRSAMDLFDFEKSANLKHPNVYIRAGHAPIFADAHRCASDAHQCALTASIVKKINFFDQNIVILDSYFSFLRMDKTKWDEQ